MWVQMVIQSSKKLIVKDTPQKEIWPTNPNKITTLKWYKSKENTLPIFPQQVVKKGLWDSKSTNEVS